VKFFDLFFKNYGKAAARWLVVTYDNLPLFSLTNTLDQRQTESHAMPAFIF
jgi:hypothetical protein